jgi:hypothetical protein
METDTDMTKVIAPMMMFAVVPFIMLAYFCVSARHYHYRLVLVVCSSGRA